MAFYSPVRADPFIQGFFAYQQKQTPFLEEVDKQSIPPILKIYATLDLFKLLPKAPIDL